MKQLAPDKILLKALDLYDEGYTSAEIAAKLGLGLRTVQRLLKEAQE
jgi:DNA-binding transcriptional regulator LsrR (DeoR family)